MIKTKCHDNVVVLKDFIQQDRVYDFLVRLNPKFDQVRIQILGKQEVSCFNEVVELIRGEESRMSVMLEPQTLDESTLVAKTEYSKQGKNDLPKHLGRDNQWKENKISPIIRNQGTQKRSVGSWMVNHQVVNGETVEGNKVLKHTWQSNRKLRKFSNRRVQ